MRLSVGKIIGEFTGGKSCAIRGLSDTISKKSEKSETLYKKIADFSFFLSPFFRPMVADCLWDVSRVGENYL